MQDRVGQNYVEIRRLINFSMEVSSKLAIITLMNDIPINSYQFDAMQKRMAQPAEGLTEVICNGKKFNVKWFFRPTPQEPMPYLFEIGIMEENKANPILLGSNGSAIANKELEDNMRKVPFTLAPKEADDIAKSVGSWLILRIKELGGTE